MVLILLVILLIALVIYFALKYFYLKLKVNEEVFKIFEKWREKELEKESLERAKLLFEKWKMEEEEKIREDAIKKSTSTILGKIGEQIAPLIFLKNYGINLKDVRFIGSPVDFVAFKNLSENKPEKIVFIEVKFSKSQLSEKEIFVKELVNKKRVEFLEINLSEEIKRLKFKKLFDIQNKI